MAMSDTIYGTLERQVADALRTSMRKFQLDVIVESSTFDYVNTWLADLHIAFCIRDAAPPAVDPSQIQLSFETRARGFLNALAEKMNALSRHESIPVFVVSSSGEARSQALQKRQIIELTEEEQKVLGTTDRYRVLYPTITGEELWTEFNRCPKQRPPIVRIGFSQFDVNSPNQVFRTKNASARNS